MDFGFELATIGDYVWFDANENGLQDQGEVGIPTTTTPILKSSLPKDGEVIVYSSDNHVITSWPGHHLISSKYEKDFPINFIDQVMGLERSVVSTFDADSMMAAIKRMMLIMEVSEVSKKKVICFKSTRDELVMTNIKKSIQEKVKFQGEIKPFKMGADLIVKSLSNMSGEVTMKLPVNIDDPNRTQASGVLLTANGIEVMLGEIM